ncbi:hypothetical protein EBU99_08200 [bacterium]|nr:hypothetical protein [bacterium]
MVGDSFRGFFQLSMSVVTKPENSALRSWLVTFASVRKMTKLLHVCGKVSGLAYEPGDVSSTQRDERSDWLFFY